MQPLLRTSSANTSREIRASAPKARSIGHYIIGKSIGEGTFGKVKLGTHTLTGEKVAIKILEKDKISDAADVERISREIHILKLIRHPNIVQLYEIIESKRELYLIMEYCSGGELFDYIVKHTRVKERESCKFLQQILSAIEYTHKLGVVHRDLKPENLLLDHNHNIKLVDFGLSNLYKPSELLKTACGSPCYAAPEMIAGKKYVGLQVDIWSMGVILFALICGYLPFEDPNTSKLYKKILAGDYKCPKFVSQDGKDLLSKVLNTDPETRYSVEQIKSHPWYQQYQQELHSGIIVGYDQVPVDQNILNRLDKYNLDKDYARQCVETNRHNHVTTTYYLLLKRHLSQSGVPSTVRSLSDTEYRILIPRHNDKDSIMNKTIMLGNIFRGRRHDSRGRRKPIQASHDGRLNTSQAGQPLPSVKTSVSRGRNYNNYSVSPTTRAGTRNIRLRSRQTGQEFATPNGQIPSNSPRLFNKPVHAAQVRGRQQRNTPMMDYSLDVSNQIANQRGSPRATTALNDPYTSLRVEPLRKGHVGPTILQLFLFQSYYRMGIRCDFGVLKSILTMVKFHICHHQSLLLCVQIYSQ